MFTPWYTGAPPTRTYSGLLPTRAFPAAERNHNCDAAIDARPAALDLRLFGLGDWPARAESQAYLAHDSVICCSTQSRALSGSLP